MEIHHPLQKIIFIQRVAKFAASSPKKAIKLCYVTSEFRTSLTSFSGFLQLLFKPLMRFPIHLFTKQQESSSLFGMPSLTASTEQEMRQHLKECDNEKIVRAIKHGEL